MWVQNNGYVYMQRFERILKFLAKRDIEFVTMHDVCGGGGIRSGEIFLGKGMNKR